MRQRANLGEHRYVRQYVISSRLSLYRIGYRLDQMDRSRAAIGVT